MCIAIIIILCMCIILISQSSVHDCMYVHTEFCNKVYGLHCMGVDLYN